MVKTFSSDSEMYARRLEMIREKIGNNIKRLPYGPVRDTQEYKFKKIDAQCHELWVKIFKSNSPRQL